jgi:hypothetical protein
MNLFILHKSPHFDPHVIKIILEAVRMLSAAKLLLDADDQHRRLVNNTN